MSYTDENAHLFDLLQMLLVDSCDDPLCKIKVKYIHRLREDISNELKEIETKIGKEATREKALIADCLRVFVPKNDEEKCFHDMLMYKLSPLDENEEENIQCADDDIKKENNTMLSFIDGIMSTINTCMTINERKSIESMGFELKDDLCQQRNHGDKYKITLTAPRGKIRLFLNGKPYSNVYDLDKMPKRAFGTKRELRDRVKKLDPKTSKFLILTKMTYCSDISVKVCLLA